MNEYFPAIAILAALRRLAARSMLAPALLSLSTAAVYAQNTLESVSATMQSESQVVRVDFARPLMEVPAGFLVQSPARIALDFPGTSSAVGRSAIDVNQGNLHSLNVVQSGERTRLVLNLRRATSYKAEIQGNSLLVMLDPAVGQAKVMPVSSAFAENRNRDVLPLREVDFRLGTEKTTGRMIVDLANSQVGVDIRQQGRNLVVEFAQSTLPEGLQRRMDVADYGTPVQLIAMQQVGDRVRMTIEPKGDWEHSAYQRNNQFVVEVRPRTTDATKLTQGIGYTGEKLSLNFQSIDVRTLLQVIADFTNFNIVASDSVTGTITLRLQDVPWDQALDIILEAKNLGMRKNGSVLRIAPEDEINAKEKLKFESQAAIQNLEPMQTRSFQLNYAKAPMIAQSLTGSGSSGGGASGSTVRILSARGSVIAEPRTNQLFVSDIPSRIAQVAELIQKLDVSMRQVLIEARIVEASDTFSRSLGVKLGGSTKGSNSSIGTQATTSSDGTTSFSGNSSSNFVNLPASSSSGSSVGTFAVSLYNSTMSKILNLEISALEDEGKGKVVASPRVVTADQTKALIEQGTELPYQTATSSGATSISFRKANLKLEVTPQITPEGNIILTLDVNKDSVGQSTSAGYAINTKHIQTEVLVENGGTVVIGGIFELTDNTDESRVPLLGELPVVGALFRSRTRSLNKTELLVFITPKMIAERTALR